MDFSKPSVQLAGTTNLSLLAEVRSGFVAHSFQRVSHAQRLQKVLNVLNALRLGQRERVTEPAVLPDLIGRLESVHEFRFSLLEPKPGEPLRFLLSVTFDGGWEPYMRFIWRDLGTLLDLMFCHCVGYPLAAQTTYPEYIAWVRKYEIAGSLQNEGRNFYFADAPVTVGDHRRLASGQPVELSAPTLAQRAQAALRPIAALYQLAPLFTGAEADTLLRAAHDIVVGIRDDHVMRDALPPGHPLRQTYRAELEWFEAPRRPRPARPASRGSLNPADLQGGILTPYPGVNHGVLVMLRVTDRVQAVQALRQLAVSKEVDAARAGSTPSLHCNIAFTFVGLQAFGVPADQLALFPQEFIQGMEMRSGLLGDVRGNHPSQWRRPRRATADGSVPKAPHRIDLSMVHVVVQWRAGFNDASFHADEVHTGFDTAQQALLASGGLEILARQALRRETPPTATPAKPPAATTFIDHLGFVDGLSQPTLQPTQPAPLHWSDQVSAGEIFLGHGNDRGDGPVPEEPSLLLDHGSFLVVRKLRQHVGVLTMRVEAKAKAAGVPADALLEAMVGRKKNGDALVSRPVPAGSNDFNFHGDADGRICPLQSHVRRSNPREGTQKQPPSRLHAVPRILRRGMAYGSRFDAKPSDDVDRGVVFMAYAASLAEQFEVIQRWIAGGNSTGLVSTEADPLLGVPQVGRERLFTCHVGGHPREIDLGPQPFVTLQWGLYLFAPSLPALKNIGSTASAAVAQPVAVPASEPWAERLEALDIPVRSAAWAEVRRQPGGVLMTDAGVLVGSPAAVREVFDNPGGWVSVEGYGERMRASVGLTHLGMDSTAHAQIAPAVNAAIETLGEAEAFLTTYTAARQGLDRMLTASAAAGRLQSITLDLGRFIDGVLAGLCTQWFGLPDGRHVEAGSWRPGWDGPPRCPGDVLSASRYVFNPTPSADAVSYGQAHGQALKDAARAYLREHSHFAAPLASKIEAAVRTSRPANPPDIDDEVARTVVGVIFGFTPTVYGNARTVLGLWLRETGFWQIQLALASQPSDPTPRAAFVRGELVKAMMKAPVPDMLWRRSTCNHTLAGTRIDAGSKLVVGVLSASQGALEAGRPDPLLMFGGPRHGEGSTMHACPGYGLAMGVLTGLMLALLEAGTVQRTASQTTVTLERESA